jgi:hypothetical protein
VVNFNSKERRLIAADGGLPGLPKGQTKDPILKSEFDDTPEERQPIWVASAATFEYTAAGRDLVKRRDAIAAHLIAAMRLLHQHSAPTKPLFDLWLAFLELSLIAVAVVNTRWDQGRIVSRPLSSSLGRCLGMSW